MSFANLQQVEVKQGPFQRLLGLADVRVRSAGGGDHGEAEGEPLHTGLFHSVENAEEIRDLILARLKAFREAGLGDPDHAELRPRSRLGEARGVSAGDARCGPRGSAPDPRPESSAGTRSPDASPGILHASPAQAGA